MEKEDTREFDEDSKYIPGIYNYCDRWCERCQFTSRCLSCALVEEKFGDLEAHDLNNKEFWQKLAETLQEALSMLKEIAEEQGINLDFFAIEEDGQLEKHADEKAVISLISHMSKAYIKMVDNWSTSNEYLLENKVYEHNIKPNLKLIRSGPMENGITIEEALEVIRWYQYQIHIKLLRAIKSKKREESPGLDDFPRDSDGSAKVALLGIDRSISSWDELLKHLPEQKEEILNLNVHLNQLRERVESEFPNARAFIRPGFDESR